MGYLTSSMNQDETLNSNNTNCKSKTLGKIRSQINKMIENDESNDIIPSHVKKDELHNGRNNSESTDQTEENSIKVSSVITKSCSYDRKKDIVILPPEQVKISDFNADIPLSDPTDTDEEPINFFHEHLHTENLQKKALNQKLLPLNWGDYFFKVKKKSLQKMMKKEHYDKPIQSRTFKKTENNRFFNTTSLSLHGPYSVSTESYPLSLKHSMVQWSKIRILRILNRLGLTSSPNLDKLMEADILKKNLTIDLKIIKRAKIDAKKCLDKSTFNIMEINVLCIGLPSVGKTSTICNMLGLDKSTLESYVTSKTVKVISGTAYNVKWNFIDTPGMDPDKFRARFNKNILKKIIKKCKKIKPDICLYFDRMDNCRNKEASESHLFEMIKEDFKLNIDDNIFEDLIVVLTHARSVKGLMNHKSYDELFYEITDEITEDLKTITNSRIYFNFVENKDHDSLFLSFKRQSIVERLSLLTTIKK